MPGRRISWEDVPPNVAQQPKRIRRVRDLSFGDWLLIIRMLSVLVAFELLRHVRSLPELIRVLEPDTIDGGDAPRIDRQVQICDAILRRLYGKDYCLRRSVILFHVLRRDDNPVRFVMGVVIRDNDSLIGHAWLEMNGEPLAEVVDPRNAYAVTYSYPAKPSSGT